MGLNEYVALTLDVPYMDDKYVPDEGTNVDGCGRKDDCGILRTAR
jgi:hypothetical protein